jgi:hypothetical protein
VPLIIKMLNNSNIIFRIDVSHFIKNILINPMLLAHSLFTNFFKFYNLYTCLLLLCLICIHMNLSRSEIQILLSNSVTSFNMVILLLTFVAFNVVMLISILIYCTSLGGNTIVLSIFPSSTSFCVIFYPFTNHYSTHFSSDFWMCVESISVPYKLPCSLELQLFFPIIKNSAINVLNLYMFWIMDVQIAFSHGIIFFFHTLKMIMNMMVISLPMVKYSTF